MTPRTIILCGRTRQSRKLATRTTADIDPYRRPNFLYITGGQRKAALIQESFWRATGKSPTFLPAAHTFGHYRQQLCERFGGPAAELTTLSRDLLIGRLWNSIRADMKCWGGLPDSPSTRKGLAKLLEDWQQSFVTSSSPDPGRSPDEFPFAVGPSGGSSALHADFHHDLWLLARSWTDLLDANPAYTDRAGSTRQLLRVLTQRPLPTSVRLHLARFSSLVVDDLLWLSPLDRALLDALIDGFLDASHTGQVRLCLESNHQDEQDLRAFVSGEQAHLEQGDSQASLALRQCWYQRVEAGTAQIVSAESSSLDADISDLLASDGFVVQQAAAGAARLRSYGSELAEVRAIARSLKAKLRSGASPRDCAVAFPALDRYLPLVRDSFAAYGIPYVVERGAPLGVSPPVSAARQLLRIAALGGGREELRTLLATDWITAWVKMPASDVDALVADAIPGQQSSDQADRKSLQEALLDSTDKTPTLRADMSSLHRTLVECGACDGPPAKWLSPAVAQCRAKLKAEIARRPIDEHAGIQQRRWTAAARTLRAIHTLDEFYLRVLALRHCVDIAAAATALKDLLAEFVLTVTQPPESQGNDPLIDSAYADNARALARFDELLDEVSTATNICDRIGTPAGQQDSAIHLLHTIVEQKMGDTYYNDRSAASGVSITGLRDLRGVDIPWLWLGGAVESELPRSSPASFLLPPAARGRIEGREAAVEDRALFFSLLRNFEHGEAREHGFLCVSWPKTVGGKDVPPAALIQGLTSLRLKAQIHSSQPEATHETAALGAHWETLQQIEENALPALLCEQELLVDPRAAELSEEFLDANLRHRLKFHRSLRAARADLRGFGRFDGVIGLGTEHRASSLRWLRNRLKEGSTPSSLRFSATTLEAWARCPMRYFLRTVLSAEDPRPWSPEPGPAEQGVILHRVLERLFAERIEAAALGKLNSAGLNGCSATESAAVKLRLRQLAFEAADEVLGPQDTPYRAELLRQLTAGLDPTDPDNSAFAGRLSLFVDEEVEPFLDLDPVATEHSFEPFNPAATADRLDGAGTQSSGDIEVQVSGTIDRVDRASPDQNGLVGTTHGIYDYKTGKVDPLKSIDLGLNMQPVVYAAAVAGQDLDSTVTGYRRLPAQPESGRQKMAGSPSSLKALKAQVAGFGRQAFPIDLELWPVLLRRIEWYGQLIATGFFPTTLAGTKAAKCESCDYRRVCRHDALRGARTDPHLGGCGSFLPRPQRASTLLRGLQIATSDAAEGERP